MKNLEDEFIWDRFVTGVCDDKLRAELLCHKNPDSSVATLAEVVDKAKAREAAMLPNAKLMEAKITEEQVHFQPRSRSSSSQSSSCPSGSSYPYCGAPELYTRKTCPAGKPGIYCSHCFGRNHIGKVCQGPKNHFKDQREHKQQSKSTGPRAPSSLGLPGGL